MNRIYPDINGNLRNGNIELFLEIVVDNYLKMQENKKACSKAMDELKMQKAQPPYLTKRKQEEQQLKILSSCSNLKLTIQSIVVLNTFFESLINEIGIIELGETYYKKNLDSLNASAKWELVLKLIYQKGLNKESQYYENIKLLTKSRNSLIHYKSFKIPDNKIDSISKSLNNTLQHEKILEKTIESLNAFFIDLNEIIKERKILQWSDINNQLQRLEG